MRFIQKVLFIIAHLRLSTGSLPLTSNLRYRPAYSFEAGFSGWGLVMAVFSLLPAFFRSTNGFLYTWVPALNLFKSKYYVPS